MFLFSGVGCLLQPVHEKRILLAAAQDYSHTPVNQDCTNRKDTPKSFLSPQGKLHCLKSVVFLGGMTAKNWIVPGALYCKLRSRQWRAEWMSCNGLVQKQITAVVSGKVERLVKRRVVRGKEHTGNEHGTLINVLAQSNSRRQGLWKHGNWSHWLRGSIHRTAKTPWWQLLSVPFSTVRKTPIGLSNVWRANCPSCSAGAENKDLYLQALPANTKAFDFLLRHKECGVTEARTTLMRLAVSSLTQVMTS